MARFNASHTAYEWVVTRFSNFKAVRETYKYLFPLEYQAEKARRPLGGRHVTSSAIPLDSLADRQDAPSLPYYSSFTQALLGPWKNFPGALNPIGYILKDFRDIVKPYKSDKQRSREWLQIVSGLANLFRAAINLLHTPVMLYLHFINYLHFFLIKYPARLYHQKNGNFVTKSWDYIKNLAVNTLVQVNMVLYWLIKSVVHSSLTVVQGIFQILTYPLTIIIKMNYRSWITPRDGDGNYKYPDAKDNKGLKRYAAAIRIVLKKVSVKISINADRQARGAHESSHNEWNKYLDDLCHCAHFKILRALSKGQPCELTDTKFPDLETKAAKDSKDISGQSLYKADPNEASLYSKWTASVTTFNKANAKYDKAAEKDGPKKGELEGKKDKAKQNAEGARKAYTDYLTTNIPQLDI